MKGQMMQMMRSDEARARQELLNFLQNQTGDLKADHIHAEDLLVNWLKTFDTELAEAWVTGSNDWWYA